MSLPLGGFGLAKRCLVRMFQPVNATGWTQLFNADLIGAAYTVYNTGVGTYFVFILFAVFQAMLYLKTRNLTLGWVTGVLFLALYAGSVFVEPLAFQFIFILLVLELGGILFVWLFG